MATKELYQGICVGGPMDGQEGQSRFPKGFVLADPVGDRACVYDYQEQPGPTHTVGAGRFVARKEDVLDKDKAWSAAQSTDWDVRAYDDHEMPEGLEVGL